jgi:hypothetical protein
MISLQQYLINEGVKIKDLSDIEELGDTIKLSDRNYYYDYVYITAPRYNKPFEAIALKNDKKPGSYMNGKDKTGYHYGGTVFYVMDGKVVREMSLGCEPQYSEVPTDKLKFVMKFSAEAAIAGYELSERHYICSKLDGVLNAFIDGDRFWNKEEDLIQLFERETGKKWK